MSDFILFKVQNSQIQVQGLSPSARAFLEFSVEFAYSSCVWMFPSFFPQFNDMKGHMCGYDSQYKGFSILQALRYVI